MTFPRRHPPLAEASGARTAEAFSTDRLTDLPAPARRYLRHAIAPGTPLARIVRLEMEGSMRPRPGGPQVALTADEVLAPHVGFTWTARARMFGLPVRVRDHYFENEGGGVTVLGVVPVARETGADVTRSSRGRLVAEAVWCPTALVGPDVRWAGVDADRARFTLTVDGDSIPVTIHVGHDGALRDVTLERWGIVDVPSARPSRTDSRSGKKLRSTVSPSPCACAAAGGMEPIDSIRRRRQNSWSARQGSATHHEATAKTGRGRHIWPVSSARTSLVER